MRAIAVIKLLETFGTCECGNNIFSSEARTLEVGQDTININCNMCGKDISITYEER
jgi:transcription elongation factor Elf1